MSALLMALGVPLASAAHAAPVTVPCSGAGGGPAGLVAAMNAANGAGGGTIRLDGGCTYALTDVANGDVQGSRSGLPEVTSEIVLEGEGATISGTGGFRIIQVAEGGHLALRDATVKGGGAHPEGGGILNAGALDLVNTTVSDNTAGGGTTGWGGGIRNYGTARLKDSTVRNNSVNGNRAAEGAGIYSDGTLVVKDSAIVGNLAEGLGTRARGDGAGIANFGMAKLYDAKISGNTAHGRSASGAGVANFGTIVLKDSHVNDNTAASGVEGYSDTASGGGIYNGGGLRVVDSTVTRNTVRVPGPSVPLGFAQGGGIFNNGSAMALAGSSVRRNSAEATGGTAEGGGVYSASDVSTITFRDSGVSGNTPDNCAPPGQVPGC